MSPNCAHTVASGSHCYKYSTSGSAILARVHSLHNTAVTYGCGMQVGDHSAALRLLALTMGDVRAAEAYCEAHVGDAGYEALMEMLLRPSPGRSPLFAEACHLLANTGLQTTRKYYNIGRCLKLECKLGAVKLIAVGGSLLFVNATSRKGRKIYKH